jgi:hypothetical protein
MGSKADFDYLSDLEFSLSIDTETESESGEDKIIRTYCPDLRSANLCPVDLTRETTEEPQGDREDMK